MTSERDSFLAEVSAALPLPPAARAEVLEELAAHLDDEVAELVDAGYPLDRAEREALRRLGSARDLGQALTEAQRGSDRLLAAAGGGAWSAVRAAIPAALLAWVLIVVATVAAMIIFRGLGERLGLDIRLLISGGWNTVLTAFGLGFGAFIAGSAAVRGAGRSGWRTRDQVRPAVAALGGPLVALLVVTLIDAPENWASVVALSCVPVAFIAGTRFDGLRSPSLPMVLVVLTVSMVLVVALGAASASGGAGASYSWDDASHGYEIVGPWWQDPSIATPDFVVVDFSSLPPGTASVVVKVTSPAALAELRGFRLEAWKAEAPRDGWRLLPDQTHPFATAPATIDSGQTTLSGQITFDSTPDVEWSQAIMTAADPAGRRVIIAAGGPVQTEFRGTVLDWYRALAR